MNGLITVKGSCFGLVLDKPNTLRLSYLIGEFNDTNIQLRFNEELPELKYIEVKDVYNYIHTCVEAEIDGILISLDGTAIYTIIGNLLILGEEKVLEFVMEEI